jgi:hypothetical protein
VALQPIVTVLSFFDSFFVGILANHGSSGFSCLFCHFFEFGPLVLSENSEISNVTENTVS